MFFKVLGYAIYGFIEKIVYIICVFNKTNYPKMICHSRMPHLMVFLGLGFLRYWWTSWVVVVFQNKKKIVILMFRIKLVSYYLSKGFLIIDPNSDALDNVPLKFKQQIRTIDKYGTDYSIPFNLSIPSSINTLKNIHLKS